MPGTVLAEAGEGAKSGNYLFTAGASLTGGYNSNIFYESSDSLSDPSSAPLLSIRPFFGISTIEEGGVDLKLDADLSWTQYLASEDTVSGQSGLSASAQGLMAFNRAGSFSLSLEDTFTRTNEAPSSPTDTPHNRILNSAGATIGIHPGGHVFQHYLSYNWLLYRHNEDIAQLDKMGHKFSLVNYWRFLPRTALMLSGDYGLLKYDSPTRSGPLANVDSSSLRVKGGLTGLISPRIQLRLTGGYGWAFYDAGPSHNGLLLDIQASWTFGVLANNSKLYAGYDQGFEDSTISNYYTYLRPYIGMELGIERNRLRLGLELDTRFKQYQGTPQSNGTFTFPETLQDTLVSASAFGTVNIRKWWSVDLRYTMAANFTSDNVINNDFGSEALRDYINHSINLGTTIRY